jgi:hypothetical protein
VHRYSTDIPASDFNFASMEAGARRQANLFRRRAKRQRTANCAARSIERRQNPVAGRLDQNTAMVCDGLNRQPVVTVQQSSLSLIAYRGGATLGIYDIRKQHSGENAFEITRQTIAMARDKLFDVVDQRFDVAGEERVIPTGIFDKPSVVNFRSEFTTGQPGSQYPFDDGARA